MKRQNSSFNKGDGLSFPTHKLLSTKYVKVMLAAILLSIGVANDSFAGKKDSKLKINPKLTELVKDFKNTHKLHSMKDIEKRRQKIATKETVQNLMKILDECSDTELKNQIIMFDIPGSDGVLLEQFINQSGGKLTSSFYLDYNEDGNSQVDYTGLMSSIKFIEEESKKDKLKTDLGKENELKHFEGYIFDSERFGNTQIEDDNDYQNRYQLSQDSFPDIDYLKQEGKEITIFVKQDNLNPDIEEFAERCSQAGIIVNIIELEDGLIVDDIDDQEDNQKRDSTSRGHGYNRISPVRTNRLSDDEATKNKKTSTKKSSKTSSKASTPGVSRGTKSSSASHSSSHSSYGGHSGG